MTPALVALVAAALAAVVNGHLIHESGWTDCTVWARTEAGSMCGVACESNSGFKYASFFGVPYAKQPLGNLRFKELRPLEPWLRPYRATYPRAVCPQTDVFYQQLKQAKGNMSEECIYANVHAPLAALRRRKHAAGRGLPILVFVHGGGFAFGSGDTDLHGPEYMVSKNVIVITFNYRLNLLGFLSLNSAEIPGNNGLRDVVTLLKWVRRNARYFGGDIDNITLAGQSAGAVMTHLLTLSPAAKGLFKRAIAMSGVATSDFFSSSPLFASYIANETLSYLDIEPTLSPTEIHRRLVAMPIDRLIETNKLLLDKFGLTTFVPVVESPHAGVTPILEEDPEVLMNKGYGKDIHMLMGLTDKECESFVPRFREIDVMARLRAAPELAVTPRMTFMVPPIVLPTIITLVKERYLYDDNELDTFVRYCTDAYYSNPALRVAAQRQPQAPTLLYRFSYSGQRSALKEAFGLQFEGAGHVEDLTYVFRPEAVFAPGLALPPPDARVVSLVTSLFYNFMVNGVSAETQLQHSDASDVEPFKFVRPDRNESDMMSFFDKLYELGRQ